MIVIGTDTHKTSHTDELSSQYLRRRTYMNEDDEKRHQDEEVLDTVAPLGDEDLTVDDNRQKT